MDWRHRALCRDEDPELFFPIGTTGPALVQIEQAKAVCRRCYVHPAVLEHYLDGATVAVLRSRAASLIVNGGRHLSREETAVLALLHRRMSRNGKAA